MAGVIQQRMDREHHVGVVLANLLVDRLAHSGAEHSPDGSKGRLGVARVVNGAPRRARTADDGRIEGREAPYHRRALRDEWVGDGHLAGGVEQFESVGQRTCGRAVTTTGVAEEDEDPGRGGGRRRSGRRLLR